MEKEPNITPEVPRERLSKRIFKWTFRLIIGVVLAFLLLFLVLQIPFVQNWTTQKITKTLSNSTGTNVEIDHLSLEFFDRLILKKFYVEDIQADTLIYCDQLKVNFSLNPITLIRRGLEIEEITLQGARVNIITAEEAFQNNFDLIMERLFPPDTSTVAVQKKPFHLNMDKIYLYDVHFFKEDNVKGKILSIYLTEGILDLEELNLPEKRIIISTADFIAPQVRIEEFFGKPAPGHDPWAVEPVVAIDTSTQVQNTDTTKFFLAIHDFYLESGQFKMDHYRKSPVKLTPTEILDYKHMDVFDIQIEIDSFSYDEETFKGQVNKIALQDISGFKLNKLSGKEVSVSSTKTEINGLEIITPDSHIGDTLVFKYREYLDFEEFEDKVRLDGRLNDVSVALKDIMVFAPKLEENNFFSNNKEEILTIDGRVSGRINNLRGRNLNIKLADGTDFVGDLSTRNLAVKNEELINFRVDKLHTTINTLRQLLPTFTPPSNFDRLGNLDFKGSFDGFFQDFVAFGDLSTDLGRAQMDMRMNFKGGLAKANYSGKLRLENFDLGTWSDNTDLGMVNFTTEVTNGIGLTAETANAELSANIESFFYRGYNYQNATLQGELKKNLFDGDFSIRDDNIDFGFNGKLNFADSIPVFDFAAKVNNMDLKTLNLSKEDVVLAGTFDLNLRNNKISDMEGLAKVYELSFLHNRKDRYVVDSIIASSIFDALGNKEFILSSDVANAKLVGQFDLNKVPDVFLQYLERNYPAFSERFGIKSKSETPDSTTNFDYDIQIVDSKGLHKLVNDKLGPLQNIVLAGHFDNDRDSLMLDFSLPFFKFGQLQLVDVFSRSFLVGEEGSFDMFVDSTIVNDKQKLAPVKLLSIMSGDTLNFGLTYETEEPSQINNLELNGQFFLKDSTNFQVSLDRSNLVLFQSDWLIESDNHLIIGKDYIDTKNIRLVNGEREIELKSYDRNGLKLSLNNFDFDIIDQNWDYEPLDFEGHFNVLARVGDVFKMKDIEAVAISDTLFINGDDWGGFRLDASAADLDSPFNGYLTITNESEASQLTAEGFFNPKDMPVKSKRGLKAEERANYFDFDLNITHFPVAIAEYFIGNTISNTVGNFDANLRINGLPKQPNIGGKMYFQKGATTVNYLKTRYFFENATINVDNYLFDASPTIIKDKYHHTAVIYGGIKHDHLRDLGFQARLSTQRFLALDTKKGDNSLFYGQAIGSGFIEFSGSFKKPNINILAKAGDSTKIVIPIDYGKDASELNYIRFVKEEDLQEKQEKAGPQDLTGLSMEMNLSFTEEADMEMVFNEQAGDIIKGKGRGDIRILLPRGQGFQMYGDYYIERGDYLFTMYNVINKEFKIKKGGRINWSGDPYGANIKLDAEYQDLNTSVSSFIAEYLVNETAEIKSDASKSTDVDLTMKLEGELLQPIINFDIDFPELKAKLKTYTDGKMRLLRQDQNELNRQVFGLIVAGQFLPSDFSVQGGDIIYNTLSEFASNQLSLMITELFSEFISDDKALSGIDFDIAYNKYRNVNFGSDGNINSGDELEFSLTQNFWNDRLSILVGGNVDFNNSLASTGTVGNGTFFGNDVVIEYVLNKDRSLKLKVYERLEPEIAGGGRRVQVGTGISFRKEYESFGAFLKSLSGKYKNRKANGTD